MRERAKSLSVVAAGAGDEDAIELGLGPTLRLGLGLETAEAASSEENVAKTNAAMRNARRMPSF